ncbi:aldehyde dehydrogenase family protein, partial [uncultured Psychrobacter sp.]|uniref:aldehyde dehydrogenase family protein n=1 Tax=uncultured Psychrobacter sp. TaxID=259303 RepID=UPI00261FCCD0
MHHVQQLINGEFSQSNTSEWINITDPATQDIIAKVPQSTDDEINEAVATAKAAFATWRKTPITTRARIFLKYQALIREHMDELAQILTAEQGKTLADARGDVFRGLEVVEHAAGIANLQIGDFVENVASDVDTYSIWQPLGVCAGITPFNFPAMIPLWMFPMAIACGNSFVLKPSEQDPMTPNRLAELFQEAGAAPGLLQVVHGGKEQVDTLLTHPDIKAVSFGGSVPVGQHVYRTAT